MSKISQYLKALVAACGAALMIWNTYSPGFIGVLPESWAPVINLIVGIVTAVATWGVPNTTDDPAVAGTQSVQLRSGRHARPE